MRLTIYFISLQLIVFFLITANYIDEIADDIYLVDGLKVTVQDDMMPLFQNNMYWIKAYNKDIDKRYWVDNSHQPDKKIFYCGKYSSDSSCISYISTILKSCHFNDYGSVYWTYADGVFLQWNSSKILLKNKLKVCKMSFTGNMIKTNASSEAVNLLLISFLFLLITMIPFLFKAKEVEDNAW